MAVICDSNGRLNRGKKSKNLWFFNHRQTEREGRAALVWLFSVLTGPFYTGYYLRLRLKEHYTDVRLERLTKFSVGEFGFNTVCLSVSKWKIMLFTNNENWCKKILEHQATIQGIYNSLIIFTENMFENLQSLLMY